MGKFQLRRNLLLGAATCLLMTGLAPIPADAQEASFNLTIYDNRFEPATLRVPAGKKIVLHVRNARSQPAEFESNELNREKVIAPGTSVVVYVGPLSPGSYGFFDDFHPSTRGQLVAK